MTTPLALPNFTTLHINGADAATFLQGQVCADVNQLTAGKSVLTACCDHKGRMVANFWLLAITDGYLMIVHSTLEEILLAHLTKYAAFSKVAARTDDAWKIYGDFNQNKTAKYCLPLPGDDQRFLLVFDNNSAPQPDNTNIMSWQLADIAAGIGYLQITTTGSFTPQMINLEKFGGVSFTKGCYLGQEVVARTQHLGKLKRHLYHVNFSADENIVVGNPLIDDNNNTLGILVNLVIQNNHQATGLAVIQDRGLENDLFIGNEKHICSHINRA